MIVREIWKSCFDWWVCLSSQAETNTNRIFILKSKLMIIRYCYFLTRHQATFMLLRLMVRCNFNPKSNRKLFALLLSRKCRTGLDFLMERIIYSPRNLNFCILPGTENHTSNITWWKMSKGCGYKNQDLIKINIIDMQLQCKVNEVVILSFLSKCSSLFWAWVTQKIQEKAEGLKLIGW